MHKAEGMTVYNGMEGQGQYTHTQTHDTPLGFVPSVVCVIMCVALVSITPKHCHNACSISTSEAATVDMARC